MVIIIELRPRRVSIGHWVIGSCMLARHIVFLHLKKLRYGGHRSLLFYKKDNKSIEHFFFNYYVKA